MAEANTIDRHPGSDSSSHCRGCVHRDLLRVRQTSTMTARPTNNPLTIFEGGRLRPGIYKIQNLYHQNYLDIQEHSRQLFCRPARDLEDGRGLVRRHLPPAVRVSDN